MRKCAFSTVRALLVIALLGAALPLACSPPASSCHGDTSPCEVLSEADCAATSPGTCAWEAACTASCLGPDIAQCPATGPQGPCYLAYTQECVPRVQNPCGALSESECGAMPACKWVDLCHGQLQCSSFGTEADCNQHLQCGWQVDSF